MMQPLISVVLGSYNRHTFLPLTIQSVRDELHDVHHEIIVVDGGSDDGALAWLVHQKDIITIVQHNRGEWHGKPITRRSWGYFMNLGFKAAQGKFICMISDDCILVPNAIKNGIKAFDQATAHGNNIGAVAFYWREWSRAASYHVGHTLGNRLYVNHGLFLNDAVRAVGYIDEETYFFYNGDGDLCLKLWHKGYEVIESPDSYIEHYPHASVEVRKTNYERHAQDEKRYFAQWDGIFYDKGLHNIGMIKEKMHHDVYATGDRFKKLHETVIAQHPEVVKPPSLYVRAAQRCRWVTKALKARAYKIFSR